MRKSGSRHPAPGLPADAPNLSPRAARGPWPCWPIPALGARLARGHPPLHLV